MGTQLGTGALSLACERLVQSLGFRALRETKKAEEVKEGSLEEAELPGTELSY